MKFICSQKILSDAISMVQRAVPTSTPHPILEGIHIETVSDVLRLKATDTDITIEVYIKASIIENGSVIVPSKMFGDIIRKFAESEVHIKVNENRIKIKCQNSVVNLYAIPGDYPDTEEEKSTFTIEFKQSLFKKMIQQTVFAAAVSEQLRPEFTGALLEFKGKYLTIVCLDGFRLALAREIISKTQDSLNPDEEVIIPAKTMNEISKILGHMQDNMDIRIGDRHIVFDFGMARITSKLLSGQFIDYRKIISENYKTRIKLDRTILYKSIDRASVLSKDDKNNLIEINIQEGNLVIKSTSEYGDIYEEVPILLTGKEMEIAFNSRYCLEVLRNIEDQEVCIDFIDKNNPCIIRPIDHEKYAYMILPVRTRSS